MSDGVYYERGGVLQAMVWCVIEVCVMYVGSMGAPWFHSWPWMQALAQEH